MTETAEDLEHGQEHEQEEQQHQEEEQKGAEFSLEARESQKQEKAREQGWKDFDEHVANGGDPDEWKTAGEFLIHGEMVAERDSWKQGYENKAKNLQTFYEGQLAAQRQELERKFNDAIESGDPDAIKQTKADVDKFDRATKNAAPQVDPLIDEWNARNSWVTGDSDKAVFAKGAWMTIQQNPQFYDPVTQQFDSARALQHLESRIAEWDKGSKPRRNPPPSEKGKGSQGYKPRSRELTWDDLTPEELANYHALPGAWPGEAGKKKFLKTAQEARKLEEK